MSSANMSQPSDEYMTNLCFQCVCVLGHLRRYLLISGMQADCAAGSWDADQVSQVSAEGHHLASSSKPASISPQDMHLQLTGPDVNRSKDVSIDMHEHT